MNDHGEQIRIVQETVAGKEITFAHVMGGPAPIIYQKLGLNPQLDYGSSAIGIMNMTPPESAVIASDIAVKSGNAYRSARGRRPYGRIHRSDPFYSLGVGCGSRRYRGKKRGRRDWIYGSVLRDVDFAWEFKLGADRSGRSRKVF